MPAYDFHCNHCGADITLRYKSYRAYEDAKPLCDRCGDPDLTRRITQVNVSAGSSSRNFGNMSSKEMLSVLESGDGKAVGTMVKQVTGDQSLKTT